jgi:hypothetical protein
MWWGRDAAAWTALAAWATVGIYLALGIFALVQVLQARRLRKEQARPFVVVDFEIGLSIVLTVENLGRTLARDVTIRFDQPIEMSGFLESATPYDVNEVRLLREPLPVLPPSKKIHVLFDSGRRLEMGLPLAFGVKVRYRGPSGRKRFEDRYTLDLGMYVTTLLPPKGVPELVAEVEQLRKEIHSWRGTGRGPIVRTLDERKRDRIEVRRASLRSKGPREAGRLLRAWALDRLGLR